MQGSWLVRRRCRRSVNSRHKRNRMTAAKIRIVCEQLMHCANLTQTCDEKGKQQVSRRGQSSKLSIKKITLGFILSVDTAESFIVARKFGSVY